MKPDGKWSDRVAFAPGGAFAYKPGELVVRNVGEQPDRAAAALKATGDWPPRGKSEKEVRPARGGNRFVQFRDVPGPLRARARLRAAGVEAQVNHVLFATCCCCSPRGAAPCPPHPSTPGAEEYYEANPFYANPFYANPTSADAGGCCCSGGATANPFYANPFYANPFYANPFYANPFYANVERNPGAAGGGTAGPRRSSVRPADDPGLSGPQASSNGIRVAILDTGYAKAGTAGNPDYRPAFLASGRITGDLDDQPDLDGDSYLDVVAGHATFIAGVIEQQAPGCEYEMIDVLSTHGDGSEVDIAEALHGLAQKPPALVNMSFAGYSPLGMDVLADAIAELRSKGTVVVASAGNDATCLPAYPAALPGVVGVAALDDDLAAAPFTNYGPWVSAAARGVGIVSTFFDNFNGAAPPRLAAEVGGPSQVDPDDFHGWAKWSGTSFAAPRVVGAIANAMVTRGITAQEAVYQLIEQRSLSRSPMLGTVVD